MTKEKTKRNWRKIIIRILLVLVGIIVSLTAGTFWWKSWKNLTPFYNERISLRYPPSGKIIPEFGDSGILDKGHFFLTVIHYDCTNTAYLNNNDNRPCVDKEIEKHIEKSINKTEVTIGSQKGFLYTTNSEKDQIATNLIFWKRNIIYYLSWSDDFINKEMVERNNGVTFNKVVISSSIEELYLKLYNRIIIQLMINSIRFQ